MSRVRHGFWLLAALILLLCAPALAAQDIQVTFRGGGLDQDLHWSFPYDDQWFDGDPDSYNHRLAQGSLGLACAAFRASGEDLSHKANNIKDYFRQAGFEKVVCEQFDITPRADTIATAIASRRIGDFTLVAVAISGSGYQDEWMSNFTIGDHDKHAGFDQAAQQVYDRLLGYVRDLPAGPVKVWIAGYSRAAAVGNLTAARLLDQKQDGPEAVYAYCFATPNSSRIEGAYPSVFNVVGQFDPVASIPFSEWLYEKVGNTLYLPAQETNSDYWQRAEPVKAVYRQLTGQDYYINPECNYLVFKVFQLLRQFIPTPQVYAQDFQDIFLKTWATPGTLTEKIKTCAQLIMGSSAVKQHLAQEQQDFWTLISQEAYDLALEQMGWRHSGWNSAVGLAANIVHEHFPQRYVAWMFAYDEPGRLFTNSSSYRRFTITGPVDVTVYDGEQNIVVTETDGGAIAADAPVPVMRLGDDIIITLPGDNAYEIALHANADGILECLAQEYVVGFLDDRALKFPALALIKGQTVYSRLDEESGLTPFVSLVMDGRVYPPALDSLTEAEPAVGILAEVRMQGNPTWRFLTRALWGLGVLVTLTPIALVLRRHRRKKRQASENKN